MKRRVVSSSICCSSLKEKSMPCSLQAQDHLGDDVALDLVGPTKDAELAQVEIRRRGTRLVAAAVAEAQGLRPQHLHLQLGDPLHDLGAAHLEHGSLGAWCVVAGLGEDHAQVGDLQRLEL